MTGSKEMAAMLMQVKEGIKQVCSQALTDEGYTVLDQSFQLTPWKTEALRDTAYVTLPFFFPDRIAVCIVYKKVYATRQHEEMSYNHPKPGTQAKFLESPLKAHSSIFKRNLGLRIMSYLSKGGI
jgi:hypothetical protein